MKLRAPPTQLMAQAQAATAAVADEAAAEEVGAATAAVPQHHPVQQQTLTGNRASSARRMHVELLRGLEIFGGLEDTALCDVCSAGQMVHYERGREVVTEGEVVERPSAAMFVVLSGTLEAVAGPEHHFLCNYACGTYFGEQAVTSSEHATVTRGATVRVTSDEGAVCLRLDRQALTPVYEALVEAATSAMVGYNTKRDPLQGKKRKLVLYLLFLGVFVVTSLGMRPGALFHQNQVVTGMFSLQAAEEVETWEGVSAFLVGTLLPPMYDRKLRPGSSFPLQLVSGFQLRQVRIRAGTAACGSTLPGQTDRFVHVGHHLRRQPAADSQSRWSPCVASLQAAGASEAPSFGRGGRWGYYRAAELHGADDGSYAGELASSYPASGYLAHPPSNASVATEWAAALRAGRQLVLPNGTAAPELLAGRSLPPLSASALGPWMDGMLADGWLDHRTGAIFVDFTVADTQLGLVSAVKVAFEFHLTGRVIGAHSIKTVRHVPVFDGGDAQSWWELLFTCLTVLYLLDELKDLARALWWRRQYLRSVAEDLARPQPRVKQVAEELAEDTGTGTGTGTGGGGGEKDSGGGQTAQQGQRQTAAELLSADATDGGSASAADKADYFSDPWNVIDVLNYTLFVLSISQELRSRIRMQEATDDINAFYEPFVTLLATPDPPAQYDDSQSQASSASWAAAGINSSAGGCSAFAEQELCEAEGCSYNRQHGRCVPPSLLPLPIFYCHFVNMYQPAAASAFAATMLGVNAIVTWLKLIKYLQAFPHLAMMTITFSNAIAPTISFMLIFLIFFTGYSQSCNLVFGAALDGYSTVSKSSLSLFRALLGDFDVNSLSKVDRFLGVMLFVVFILVGMLFLLNVFIAILSEAYEKAKIEVFGDAFDERDPKWDGAMTFGD
eukprot:COSAG01_NODE_6839_length_3464_cov_10.156944_1_plen_897_part_01